MIVDRNAVVPVPVGTTPGKSGAQTGASAPDRSAWLREMEKQELTAWLSHPAQLRGHAAAPSPTVYARIDPPTMPAESSAPANVAPAEPAAGRHEPAPTATGAARTGIEEGGSGNGEAGRAAAGDSGRHAHQAGTESGEASDAGSGPAWSAGPAAPVPVELVAAVMSVLAQVQGPGGAGMQPSATTVQAVSAAGGATVVAPQLPAAALARPLSIQALPATAQRLPQPGARSVPAEDGKQSGEARSRRAPGTEQAGAPGQPSPQLRIHAMRTASGVRIWIGADQAAGLGERQLLLAAADIRRLLQDQGMPLASLTYNGESVYDAEDKLEASDGVTVPDVPAGRMKPGAGAARAPRHNDREE